MSELETKQIIHLSKEILKLIILIQKLFLDKTKVKPKTRSDNVILGVKGLRNSEKLVTNFYIAQYLSDGRRTDHNFYLTKLV